MIPRRRFGKAGSAKDIMASIDGVLLAFPKNSFFIMPLFYC
jgi:hypothetical protein